MSAESPSGLKTFRFWFWFCMGFFWHDIISDSFSEVTSAMIHLWRFSHRGGVSELLIYHTPHLASSKAIGRNGLWMKVSLSSFEKKNVLVIESDQCFLRCIEGKYLIGTPSSWLVFVCLNLFLLFLVWLFFFCQFSHFTTVKTKYFRHFNFGKHFSVIFP